MHFEHGLYRHLESLFAQARSKAPDSLAAIRGLLENALKGNNFLDHSVDTDRFPNGYEVFTSVLLQISTSQQGIDAKAKTGFFPDSRQQA